MLCCASSFPISSRIPVEFPGFVRQPHGRLLLFPFEPASPAGRDPPRKKRVDDVRRTSSLVSSSVTEKRDPGRARSGRVGRPPGEDRKRRQWTASRIETGERPDALWRPCACQSLWTSIVGSPVVRRFETRRPERFPDSLPGKKDSRFSGRNASGDKTENRKHEVKVLLRSIPRPGGRVQRNDLARRPLECTRSIRVCRSSRESLVNAGLFIGK